MYLPPENHARPGVSRESLWRRHSYELVVIGYNQQLLGTMILDVVTLHLRPLSLFVLCGSKDEWKWCVCRRDTKPEPSASQIYSTQNLPAWGKKHKTWSCDNKYLQKPMTLVGPVVSSKEHDKNHTVATSRTEHQTGTGHTDSTALCLDPRQQV